MKTLLKILIIYTTFTNNIATYILFQPDEVRHVRAAPTAESTSEKEPCSEDILMQHLAEISVVMPEHIVHLAFQNIPQMCNKISSKLKRIGDYTTTCNPPKDNDLFMSLIAGVKKLNKKLCKDDPFVRQWEKYSKCLSELSLDLHSCNGPGDWNEDEDKEAVCKTYISIRDCAYVKSTKVCGKNAASVLEDLFVDIINTVLMNVKCPGVYSHPYVRDAMPEKFINEGFNVEDSHSYILQLLTLITYFVLL